MDLWNLGVPITLGGQCVLVLGLVFQLDRLWQTDSDSLSKLSEVDQRLDALAHTTTLLETNHTSPSQAFYAHLAQEASPRMLLADVKSQLDLLAIRMGRGY